MPTAQNTRKRKRTPQVRKRRGLGANLGSGLATLLGVGRQQGESAAGYTTRQAPYISQAGAALGALSSKLTRPALAEPVHGTRLDRAGRPKVHRSRVPKPKAGTPQTPRRPGPPDLNLLPPASRPLRPQQFSGGGLPAQLLPLIFGAQPQQPQEPSPQGLTPGNAGVPSWAWQNLQQKAAGQRPNQAGVTFRDLQPAGPLVQAERPDEQMQIEARHLLDQRKADIAWEMGIGTQREPPGPPAMPAMPTVAASRNQPVVAGVGRARPDEMLPFQRKASWQPQLNVPPPQAGPSPEQMMAQREASLRPLVEKRGFKPDDWQARVGAGAVTGAAQGMPSTIAAQTPEVREGIQERRTARIAEQRARITAPEGMRQQMLLAKRTGVPPAVQAQMKIAAKVDRGEPLTPVEEASYFGGAQNTPAALELAANAQALAGAPTPEAAQGIRAGMEAAGQSGAGGMGIPPQSIAVAEEKAAGDPEVFENLLIQAGATEEFAAAERQKRFPEDSPVWMHGWQHSRPLERLADVVSGDLPPWQMYNPPTQWTPKIAGPTDYTKRRTMRGRR